jgi:hypothetical protein
MNSGGTPILASQQPASIRGRQDNGEMDDNLAGAVYGTIAVAALLAAESARRETYLSTVAAVVITLALYWLAHSYAEFTGERLRTGERITLAGFSRMMARELTILIGAAVPLGVLLIAWGNGASLTTAVNAAIWTSAAMIALIELIVGLRSDLSGRELAAQAMLGGVLGLAVVALRVVLH